MIPTDENQLPDDVTLEEFAGAALTGRPILREGFDEFGRPVDIKFTVELDITDQEIEDMLAEAGIVLDDEGDA